MSNGDRSEHKRMCRFIENLHSIKKLAGISTTSPVSSGVGSIFCHFHFRTLSLANLSRFGASAVISTSTEYPSESVMFQCVTTLIVPINLTLKKKKPPRVLLCIWPLYQEFPILPGARATGARFLVGPELEQGADVSSSADVVALCFWKIAKEETTEQLGVWFRG